jgi:hypothetical protein
MIFGIVIIHPHVHTILLIFINLSLPGLIVLPLSLLVCVQVCSPYINVSVWHTCKSETFSFIMWLFPTCGIVVTKHIFFHSDFSYPCYASLYFIAFFFEDWIVGSCKVALDLACILVQVFQWKICIEEPVCGFFLTSLLLKCNEYQICSVKKLGFLRMVVQRNNIWNINVWWFRCSGGRYKL